MSSTLRRWQRLCWRYACLCRLHRPTDLLLLWLIVLLASLLASAGSGELQWLRLWSLLLATTLMRAAAWLLNDWLDARLSPQASDSLLAQGLVKPQASQHLFIGLLGGAGLLLWSLGSAVLLSSLLTLAALAILLWMRTRLALTQLWLGLLYASFVPIAWLAQQAPPDNIMALLFLAIALWASAFTSQWALARLPLEQRLGIQSLAQIFGIHSWLLVLVLQTTALASLWLLGQRAELGWSFQLAILLAMLLLPWQIWLQWQHPLYGPLRAYHSQLLSGLILLGGLI